MRDRIARLMGWRKVRVIDQASITGATEHGISYQPERTHEEWVKATTGLERALSIWLRARWFWMAHTAVSALGIAAGVADANLAGAVASLAALAVALTLIFRGTEVAAKLKLPT